jgi:hypothetical protein
MVRLFRTSCFELVISDGSIPGEGIIFVECLGSVSNQHREEFEFVAVIPV